MKHIRVVTILKQSRRLIKIYSGHHKDKESKGLQRFTIKSAHTYNINKTAK